MAARLIFPIGHYLGPRYRGGSSAPESHHVRIGWRLHKLAVEEEFSLWALAHGLPEGLNMRPWTLGAVEGAARATGLSDPSVALDGLLRRNLVLSVDPDTEAGDFARYTRLRALHSAAGEPAAGEEHAHGLGWSGAAPVLYADDFTHELWKWAPFCDTIWHAGEVFARTGAGRRLGGIEGVLPEVLRSVQVLIAHGLAYVDEAGAD